MLKILKIVDSCGGCPNYGYDSGGRHKCKLVDEIVPDKTEVASFCPLTEFPSRMLANMNETIRLLREPNKYGIVLAVLSHISTKLKKDADRNGGITIELKNNQAPVYLRHDGITSVVPFQGAVFFVDGEHKYKLYPDTLPPQLLVQVAPEGFRTDELWEQLYIAT